MHDARQARSGTSARGFTLIELLVAIAVMALLSLVSWRGLDSMSRATTQNQQRADAVLTLQATLAQWGSDLDAVATLAQTRPIDWDGRVLRLTRRGSDTTAPSMLVVACGPARTACAGGAGSPCPSPRAANGSRPGTSPPPGRRTAARRPAAPPTPR